ncbi:MAG: NTP transferase domain-containing protein [Chthoniobacterales bacterium]|nr:NTP transferase domain-containing protein [Chthoniobacterales bacterium]
MSGPALLVLAAGMGSRYGGLKQLDAVGPNGETLLDYSVHDAIRAGFARVVFLIRRDIEAEFRAKVGSRYGGKIPVGYAFQELDDLPEGFRAPAGRTKPWGTAHAVWCARSELDSPFVAINADDFYGAGTFRVMAGYLRGVDADAEPAEFGMAAFRLGRTLSEHGAVARGICDVSPDGLLRGIEELTDITRGGDGSIAAAGRVLPADTPVSMNFWAFTPQVFPLLREELKVFLAAAGESEKAECYLPTAVASIIASGHARVRMLETESDWFGVTYRDDRESVVRSIAALVARGEYPG